jgi:glutathione peroxidase
MFVANVLVMLAAATCALSFSKVSSRVFTQARSLSMNSFYDITEKDYKGDAVDFSKFKGKVVYGVNVASRCGYTASGYALLSKIAKIDGAEVVLFPCNQFGGQEPGSNQEIAEFCTLKGVEGAFVLDKADVNGPKTRPTYKFLKEKGVLGEQVAWNFAGKFVVDKQGNVSPVKSEKTLEADILALTKK